MSSIAIVPTSIWEYFPEDITTNLLFSLSYKEASGLLLSCTRMYEIYIQHLAKDQQKAIKYINFFINNRSPEELEHALTRFPKIEKAITLDIDLYLATRLHEHFQKAMQKCPISCITIVPDRISFYDLEYADDSTLRTYYHKLGIKKIPSRVPTLCDLISDRIDAIIHFFKPQPPEPMLHSVAIERAERFSQGLALLKDTLHCIQIKQTSDYKRGICYEILKKTALPACIKQLYFLDAEKISEEIIHRCSLPNLEKIVISQQQYSSLVPAYSEHNAIPEYMQTLQFPPSLREFTLTRHGHHEKNFLPVICQKLTEQCPDLETLDISHSRLLPDQILQLPKNLKNVVAVEIGINLPIFLQSLVSHCPEIESLSITEFDALSEEVLSLLPSFKKLKKISLVDIWDPDRYYAMPIDSSHLFPASQCDLFIQMGITSLAFQDDSQINRLQCLQKNGKKLLSQLQTLQILESTPSSKMQALLNSLREEYPNLTIIHNRVLLKP
jgi:hypothetical protein